MISEIKLQQLRERFKESEGDKDEERQLTMREYVENEASNDPHFFRWLFDEDLNEDFDASLTSEQKDEYEDFLLSLPGFFTAFYDTETMKDVAYSVKADSAEEAIQVLKDKISRPIQIIQNDCQGNSKSGKVIYNDR